MDYLWSLTIIAVLALKITALPTLATCASRYPRARHSVPMYRSLPPAFGNLEADITVGTQTVRVILDTGSGNTWFMPQHVQCLDPNTLEPTSSNLCGFTGPRLNPSLSFEQLTTHSNLTFGTGLSVISADGYDRILFGGIEVPKQEISLGTTIVGTLDENVTGLLGLAYPFFTNAYPGSDPSTDVACSDVRGATDAPCNEHHYSPLLTTIFADGLTPPLFAFAISRSAPNAGVMTIGGIPDLRAPAINVTSQSAEVNVPIEKYNNTLHYSVYAISVDGLKYPGAAAGAGKGQWIVDTGTIQMQVGNEQAQKINALFDPPATYNQTQELYLVDCDAIAPDFGVEIGGTLFSLNSKDMILSGGDGGPVCESAVQATGASTSDSLQVLGSTFLRNVLAVFDIGKSEMSFASRTHYLE